MEGFIHDLEVNRDIDKPVNEDRSHVFCDQSLTSHKVGRWSQPQFIVMNHISIVDEMLLWKITLIIIDFSEICGGS